jgi:SAM-dependent methyltransferase
MKLNHVETIMRYWNATSADYCTSHPEHLDRNIHPSWGMWSIPEQALGLLGEYLTPGKHLVEMGCGQGYNAVGFAKHDIEVLAVDVSTEQLSRAIKDPRVRYVLSPAERVPTPDASIDIVTSDHGAFDYSPPQLLLKEAYRILRPGGVSAICTISPLAYTCFDAAKGKVSECLVNDYPNNSIYYDGTVTSSQLSYSQWVKAIQCAGFSILRLEELLAPPGSSAYFNDLVTAEWGCRWPLEIAWVIRKT